MCGDHGARIQPGAYLGALLRRQQRAQFDEAMLAQRRQCWRGGHGTPFRAAVQAVQQSHCHACGDAPDPAAGHGALNVITHQPQACMTRCTIDSDIFLHGPPGL